MKKAVLIFVSLILVLGLSTAGIALYSYNTTTEEVVPSVRVNIAGQQLSPMGYTWSERLLFGVLEKSFSSEAEQPVTNLGTFEYGTLIGLDSPQGYETHIRLSHDNTLVFDGESGKYTEELTQSEGDYSLYITCERPRSSVDEGYGRFYFQAEFSVLPEPPEPAIFTSATTLMQGDIFAIRLHDIPDGVTPMAETDLGMSNFLQMGEGEWLAAIPIGNTREVGDYAVKVQAGELEWDMSVSVQEFDFPIQQLTIDTSSEQISTASSDAATAEFNNVMFSLFPVADEVMHWEGAFTVPAEGRITTHFGSIRITNGDPSSARSHWGMDIANAEGTPIYAPNNGRVIYADWLDATGYTLVIEHGGGLKTIYFHLSDIFVQVDDMVQKGEHIAAMGTTGYSTGSHLHYEVRIGEQAVSPEFLHEDTAGLYAVLAEPE